MMNLSRLKHQQMLFILLAVALIVRVLHIWFIHESPIFLVPTSDEWEHYSLASHLASGDWLGIEKGTYHRPQIFPYVCAILFAVLGTEFIWVHLLNLVADVAAIPAWFFVARVAMPRGAAFLGTLALCLYRPLVHFAGTGYMESFAIMLFAWALWAFARYAVASGRRRPGAWRFALVGGFILGVGLMCRPTVILLYPIFGMMVWWGSARLYGWWTPRGLLAPALFSIAALLTVGLNTARHLLLFGLFIPLGTNSELAWHMANNRDGWGWEVSSPGIEFGVYTLLPVVESDVAPDDVPGLQNWWRERNAAYVREEPQRVLRELALKTLLVVNRWEVHCTQHYLLFDELSPIHRWLPGLGFFGPLGLLGLVVALGGAARRRSPAGFARRWIMVVLACWIVVYLAGVVMYLAIARHRLPALPPLILFSGLGVWFLWYAWRSRLYSRLVAGLAIVLLGLVITNLPVVPKWMEPHERWWTQISLGVAHRALGQPEDAIVALERANTFLADKPETFLQLAQARAEAGDYSGAAVEQERLVDLLIRLYPFHLSIHATQLEVLARYHFFAGQYEAMERAAQRMELRAHGFARPLALQALAAINLGRNDEARALIARASEIEPTLPLLIQVRAALDASQSE